jgi:hypothetical protein
MFPVPGWPVSVLHEGSRPRRDLENAADGGQETEVPELRQVLRYRYWSGTAAGIYSLDDPGTDAAPAALKFFRFSNRHVERVMSPAPPPMGGIRGLAVSPDGQQVLWVRLSRRISQILLVEGFR